MSSSLLKHVQWWTRRSQMTAVSHELIDVSDRKSKVVLLNITSIDIHVVLLSRKGISIPLLFLRIDKYILERAAQVEEAEVERAAA